MRRTTRLFPVIACVMLAICAPAAAQQPSALALTIVIPGDPNQWDKLTPVLNKLPPEQKRLVEAYLLRMGLANALEALPDEKPQLIPPNTTIGAAIKAQQDYERVNGKR